MTNKDFNKEYVDFMNTEGNEPPKHLSNSIMSYIKNELNPSHISIFFKLLSIHIIVGLLTLLFCPQFNFSLTNNYELFHYFHHNFGTYACNFVCGVIFVGPGAIFAIQILNKAEVNKIKSSKILYYLSLIHI